jgi:membrane protein YdbS with pleckstrin-like domain
MEPNPIVVHRSNKPLVLLAVVEAILLALLVTLVLYAQLDPLRVILPIVLLSSLLYGVLVLRARSSRMTIGPHQIALETGLLAKDQRAFDLSKVQDVRSEQSVFERMTGTGTVVVQTASHDGGIRMEGIDNPKGVVQQILDAQRRSLKGSS